jgi:hypothetical protein
MKEVTMNGRRVRLYDSIDELPIVRFHRYNRMLLVDAGIGSDISDFDAHIEKVVRFMKSGDKDNAAKELENMRQNVYIMLTEQSPQNLSFAALVAEIDDVEMNDLSDDGLERVRQMLEDAPRKDITAALQAVKKKIDEDLTLYFPSLFDSTDEKEYYDMMKRRAQMELEQITDGDSEERRARIAELEDRMVTAVKPRTFTGRDAFGVQHDKAYMKMCLMISSNLNADASRMTVLEYYTASEYMHEIAKERQKAVSKAGKGARV